MNWNCKKCKREVISDEVRDFCRDCQLLENKEQKKRRWETKLAEAGEVDRENIKDSMEKYRIAKVSFFPRFGIWSQRLEHDRFISYCYLTQGIYLNNVLSDTLIVPIYHRPGEEKWCTIEIEKYYEDSSDFALGANVFLNKLSEWAKKEDIRKIETKYKEDGDRIKINELIFVKRTEKEIEWEPKMKCSRCGYWLDDDLIRCLNCKCERSKIKRCYGCENPNNRHKTDCSWIRIYSECYECKNSGLPVNGICYNSSCRNRFVTTTKTIEFLTKKEEEEIEEWDRLDKENRERAAEEQAITERGSESGDPEGSNLIGERSGDQGNLTIAETNQRKLTELERQLQEITAQLRELRFQNQQSQDPK